MPLRHFAQPNLRPLAVQCELNDALAAAFIEYAGHSYTLPFFVRLKRFHSDSVTAGSPHLSQTLCTESRTIPIPFTSIASMMQWNVPPQCLCMSHSIEPLPLRPSCAPAR